MAADGVCHPTPAALSADCFADIVFTHTAAVRIANERTKTMIRDGEIGPEQSATVYLNPGGRDWLQLATTGGYSAGVSHFQTDAGRPWAAAAAALLVIHGVAAGMRRESQLRLWDVRYTGGGRLERRVERWAAQWQNVSPDWLINYPMQAVHPVYRLPVL